MKQSIRLSACAAALLLSFPSAVQADTTVTTNVVLMEQQDPRNLEGTVVRVNLTGRELLVRDINGRERQVKMMKQSMINNYKTGDYVQIYLTRDLTEAKKIRTKQIPDLEGDVVGVDMNTHMIVVRDSNGIDRSAVIRPEMIRGYRVGDRVRFYAVSENADLQEAQIIRIR